jgi:hypothetical protein
VLTADDPAIVLRRLAEAFDELRETNAAWRHAAGRLAAGRLAA